MAVDRNPNASKNWRLACVHCGERFRDEERAANALEHMVKVHGTEKVTLRLEWIGVGPAPIPSSDLSRRLLN